MSETPESSGAPKDQEAPSTPETPPAPEVPKALAPNESQQKLACAVAGDMYDVLSNIQCMNWSKFLFAATKTEQSLDVNYTFDNPSCFEALGKRMGGAAAVKKFAIVLDQAAKKVNKEVGVEYERFIVILDKSTKGELAVAFEIYPAQS